MCYAVLCCAVLYGIHSNGLWQLQAGLWCAMLCCVVLCCAALNPFQWSVTAPGRPVMCYAVLCCAVLCCAVLCCTESIPMVCDSSRQDYDVLCCAVLCCAVLYGIHSNGLWQLQAGLWCAMLCCVVLCCAVLCCAALNPFQWSVTAPGRTVRSWTWTPCVELFTPPATRTRPSVITKSTPNVEPRKVSSPRFIASAVDQYFQIAIVSAWIIARDTVKWYRKNVSFANVLPCGTWVSSAFQLASQGWESSMFCHFPTLVLTVLHASAALPDIWEFWHWGFSMVRHVVKINVWKHSWHWILKIAGILIIPQHFGLSVRCQLQQCQ